jgi:hypothetical protein
MAKKQLSKGSSSSTIYEWPKTCWAWIIVYNYTLYKNPGFWLVNIRCIFRVLLDLGLISFIFTVAGYVHEDLIFLHSGASNHQIHSEYLFFTFIRKATWLIKFETRKCSEVNDLTVFFSVVFAKACFTFYPSRALNRQILPLYLLNGTVESVL